MLSLIKVTLHATGTASNVSAKINQENYGMSSLPNYSHKEQYNAGQETAQYEAGVAMA